MAFRSNRGYTAVLDFPTQPLVIVVDESPAVRDILVRLIEQAGITAVESVTLEQTQAILDAVAHGTPCLVLLSSAYAPQYVDRLLRHDLKPKLLFSCTGPASCPVFPDVGCVDLGCVRKPDDFRDTSKIIARVRESLYR
jgi:CheY-like chemotaxis protein